LDGETEVSNNSGEADDGFGLSWSETSHTSTKTVTTFDLSGLHGSALVTKQTGIFANVEFCSVFTLTWNGIPINFLEVDIMLKVNVETMTFQRAFRANQATAVASCSSHVVLSL
jgi:hypothetical protein